jgi:6-phosphofructokinase 1
MSVDSKSLTTLVAVSFASVVGTYLTLTYLQARRDEKARAHAFAERQAAREKQTLKQMDVGEPSGTLLEHAKIDRIYLWQVQNLGERFAAQGGKILNRMHSSAPSRSFFESIGAQLNTTGNNTTEEDVVTDYNKLIGEHDCILADLVRKPTSPSWCRAYLRAGPHKYLHFDPKTVNAAVVTCGGLCPGLNDVICHLTKTLHQLYGINGIVYGIRGGYKGFYDASLPPLILTPNLVENIHHFGGTILGSSRGGFDIDKILSFIKQKNIKQLYVIGGDGTHRGAFKIHETCMERVSDGGCKCNMQLCVFFLLTNY